MIVVRITDTNLSVSGHSNDTVEEKTEESIQACASVTALVQTLLFGLIDTEPSQVDYEITHGWFWIDTEYLAESSLFLIHVFKLGVTALADAYPQYITVK